MCTHTLRWTSLQRGVEDMAAWLGLPQAEPTWDSIIDAAKTQVPQLHNQAAEHAQVGVTHMHMVQCLLPRFRTWCHQGRWHACATKVDACARASDRMALW